MRKLLLTHFVGFVTMVVAAGIPTALIGKPELGLVFGCISGAYFQPQVLKYLEKKGMIKWKSY